MTVFPSSCRPLCFQEEEGRKFGWFILIRWHGKISLKISYLGRYKQEKIPPGRPRSFFGGNLFIMYIYICPIGTLIHVFSNTRKLSRFTFKQKHKKSSLHGEKMKSKSQFYFRPGHLGGAPKTKLHIFWLYFEFVQKRFYFYHDITGEDFYLFIHFFCESLYLFSGNEINLKISSSFLSLPKKLFFSYHPRFLSGNFFYETCTLKVA